MAFPNHLKVYNGPAPTTAAQASVATGTSIKTMLQLKSTKGMLITGWGYTLDTEQAAAGTVELLETDVAATVTAFATADLVSLNTPSAASGWTKGTSASGYTGSAEGSITATQVYDAKKLGVSTTYGTDMDYVRQFNQYDRPYLAAGKILRVRITAGTSAGMICWISWAE